MNKNYISIALVLCLLGSANAFTVLTPGYTVQNYTQYGSSTSCYRMVFDDSGNLYINHHADGKIMKIDSNQQVSTLATGLSNIYDITWGGGTSYGNYIYGTNIVGTSTGEIWKVGLNGSVSALTHMSPPAHGPAGIAIDRTGNYGGYLYTGTASQDHLFSISTNGTVSLFTNWPGSTDNGGVWGIGFDTTGKYNNQMYAVTSYQQTNANLSGLFAVNPNGIATKFCSDLISATIVGFDEVGTYFDNDMFVVGRNSFTASGSLWRVYADGSCQEFMTGVNSFTFGDDGAMYVSSYDWGTAEVSVARVVPEPATLLLLASGALLLRKRTV